MTVRMSHSPRSTSLSGTARTHSSGRPTSRPSTIGVVAARRARIKANASARRLGRARHRVVERQDEVGVQRADEPPFDDRPGFEVV